MHTLSNTGRLKQVTRHIYFSSLISILFLLVLFYSNTLFFYHYVIVIKYFANVYCLQRGCFFYFLRFNHDCQVFLMFCFAFCQAGQFINIDPETFCCQNGCTAGVYNSKWTHSPMYCLSSLKMSAFFLHLSHVYILISHKTKQSQIEDALALVFISDQNLTATYNSCFQVLLWDVEMFRISLDQTHSVPRLLLCSFRLTFKYSDNCREMMERLVEEKFTHSFCSTCKRNVMLVLI